MSINIVANLKLSSLFKEIPENEIEKIAGVCTVKDLSAGETLFFENEESTSMYLVAKGTIAIKKSAKGNEDSVSNIGSNSHLGEMAMLMRDGQTYERRSATADAAEFSSVIEIPYEALQTCFKNSPATGLVFYRNMAVSLAGRIRRTTEDLSGLRSLRLRHV